MSTRPETNYYHCNKCGYNGKARVSGAAAFVLMITMLCLSAWFLPLVVVALGFMVWMLTKPAKRYCPSCKSTDLQGITDEQFKNAGAKQTQSADAKLENNR